MNLSESVKLNRFDRFKAVAGVNLSESVSLTDSTSKTAGVNLSDTVLLTDSHLKAALAGVNLSESDIVDRFDLKDRWCESIRYCIVDWCDDLHLFSKQNQLV